MKKNLLILFTILLCLGCSKDDDAQGKEGDKGIIPLAPTNLQATSGTGSQADLSWTDNSTNESGFKIERKIIGQNYSVIGTVKADIMDFKDVDLQNGKEYTYRVYAFNATGKSLTYTNEASVMPSGTPVINTTKVHAIESNSAIVGGQILSDAGAYLTNVGVVWSTEPNPTIGLSSKTSQPMNGVYFENELMNLQPETTYYAKAYAVNKNGVGYGEEISFTTAQLESRNYKITIEGVLDGNKANHPEPTYTTFYADYLYDDQTETVEYSEAITNEVWVEKTKVLSAKSKVGVKLYITQDDTFLTYIIFQIEDIDTGEVIFRGDVGPSTVVSPSSPESWGSYEIKILYDMAQKEMSFSY